MKITSETPGTRTEGQAIESPDLVDTVETGVENAAQPEVAHFTDEDVKAVEEILQGGESGAAGLSRLIPDWALEQLAELDVQGLVQDYSPKALITVGTTAASFAVANILAQTIDKGRRMEGTNRVTSLLVGAVGVGAVAAGHSIENRTGVPLRGVSDAVTTSAAVAGAMMGLISGGRLRGPNDVN